MLANFLKQIIKLIPSKSYNCTPTNEKNYQIAVLRLFGIFLFL
nr:MAG TPA: hypothetical protein [Caudoviricetes sp.]